jgi:GNAT superfamily N-acetyltransferase
MSGCQNRGVTDLAVFDLASARFVLRRATAADVGPIVALIAADQLRAAVESAEPEHRSRYDAAFAAIDADPAHLLAVVCDAAGAVVATMQLTEIPGLARAGATRLQIEAVRVRDDQRGNGVGGAMIGWAVDEARRRGAALVQLTSDAMRTDARRFYERLGFTASHVGFKLPL